MLTLKFEIQFDSNYHVGAGYGKGFNMDSALLREADGTPVLRGSTLAGLLHDGACRLLRLPPLKKQCTNEILERLFGTPKQAKHWRFTSARPAEKNLEDSQPINRVRIDPRTRRAEEGKLFSQEEGVAGQKFCFSITCPFDDEAALDEAAILVAAARNVRQLGRSRRRGLGECVIHLNEVAGIAEDLNPTSHSWEDLFLKRFDLAWMQGNPSNRNSMNAEIPSEIQTIHVPTGPAIRVMMIVRLDEPLLIAQRASAGNQYDTRPFIPGNLLMGALAGMAAERCDLANPKIYHDFIEIFLRGGIKFPMLYPGYYYSSNLYPTIPAPLGLINCSAVPFQRNEGHGAYPAVENKQNRCPKCNTRLEPVDGFLILKRKPPQMMNIQRSSELHIRINEKTQRVAKGDLYGYTAMSAGQYFIGELICANEVIWQRLQKITRIAERTPLTCRLGKARSRGYGQVTVWFEQCDEPSQTWIQIPLNRRVSDSSQMLTLTLLTDTIINNSWGQQATGFEQDCLESALGLGHLEITDVYARTRVVDGFNSTLGLPRWRETALVAGSVAWIRLVDPPKDWAERMQTLESEGIGLRRNEGFGCIAFNHPVYYQRQELRDSAIGLDQKMRLGSSQNLSRFMEEWEDKLDVLLPQERRLDAPFQTLARWMHTQGDASPQDWIDQFSSLGDFEIAFGQPDKALIAAIGENEYGKRSKDNFFIKDGKSSIEAICIALEWLNKQDSRQWRGGIERLAEWVAALASDKQNGGMQ